MSGLSTARHSAVALAAHVQLLAHQHRIDVTTYAGGGRAVPSRREVRIKPVRGVSSYYTALHEFGHIVGRGRSARTLEAEANAWQWAIDNAIRPPTFAVERMIARCLRSYLTVGRRDYGLRQGMREPDDDHVFWRLANPPGGGFLPVSRRG